MVPLSPVKYCRHPCGAFSLLLHSTWVTCTPPAHHLATTWPPGPAHLDGEGAGGGGAGGPKHGGQLVALVAGVDVHVVARVGAADHGGGCGRG